VVAVGAVGMELERRLYYEKELDFRVSRSYGPGRYDAAFEQKGIDYPIGHVRWTETRNMEAFVQLLADGKLNLKPLITQRYSIENAVSAYDLITGKNRQSYLGIVIEYPAEHSVESRRLELVEYRKLPSSPHVVKVGMLGAGNFARSVLIPAMRRAEQTELVGISASSGVRAQSAAKKFGFAFSTTDEEQIVLDDSINTVVVATRHNLHAGQIIRALECGKHVFCEKPLCLTEAELHTIQRAYSRSNSELMVGFNRRFAPMAQRTRAFLSQADGPFTMHYRVNAGPLPPTHWVNDPEQGGGRVLGEMCHFVDLLSFLCGSAPVCVRARSSCSAGGQDVTATVEFANRSIGTIMYVCSGDRTLSKERVEVFGSSSIAVLDDFRGLDLVRHGKKETHRSRLRQDKGHQAEWRAFSECIRTGGHAPIAFEEIVASTLATIRIAESLSTGQEQHVVAKEQLFSASLVS
jgi:predicted dehydrogenase